MTEKKKEKNLLHATTNRAREPRPRTGKPAHTSRTLVQSPECRDQKSQATATLCVTEKKLNDNRRTRCTISFSRHTFCTLFHGNTALELHVHSQPTKLSRCREAAKRRSMSTYNITLHSLSEHSPVPACPPAKP